MRPSTVDDAPAIARIQTEGMLESLAQGVDGKLDPQIGATLDEGAMAASWQESIASPPAPGFRILTALDAHLVAGFAAAVPAEPVPGVEGLDEPGTEIIALEVDPDHRGEGHRSRLLAALSDLAQDDGAKNIRVWIVAGDGQKIRLFQEAGFGPAGILRKLEVGPHRVVEHLWWAKF